MQLYFCVSHNNNAYICYKEGDLFKFLWYFSHNGEHLTLYSAMKDAVTKEHFKEISAF